MTKVQTDAADAPNLKKTLDKQEPSHSIKKQIAFYIHFRKITVKKR